MKKKLLLLASFAVILSSCGFITGSSDPTTVPPTSEEPTTTVDPTTSEIPTTSEDPTTSVSQYYDFVITSEVGGKVEGTESGNYIENHTISLVATAYEEYEFSGYYEGDTLVEANSSFEFNITRSIELTAKFNYIGTGDQPEFYYQSYSHTFAYSEISNSNGGTTKDINGLTWNYTSYTYAADSPKGVQIGSKNRPQTSPFTLSTTLPEGVIVTSYFINLAVASSGDSNYELTFGDYVVSGKFTSTDNVVFQEEELEVEASNISITLKATQRAMYLHSFGFTVKIPNDIELSLSGDQTSAEPVVPGQNNVPDINYPLISKDDYYSGIDFDATPSTLKSDLRTLITDMEHQSYGDARYMLTYTDENPSNEGYIYSLFDGDDILAKWDGGGLWNREHVWPCAKMALTDEVRPGSSTKNHTSDLHNLRATCTTANGYHSDKYYDEENTSLTLFPNITSGIGGVHKFTGDHRGDVARILFYMALRYDGLTLSDSLNPSNTTDMGKLSVLIEWNNLDPVDEFEIQRNNRVYEYQGNRNPFIDYPELAETLY